MHDSSKDKDLLIGAAVDYLQPRDQIERGYMTQDLSQLVAWGGVPDSETPNEARRALTKFGDALGELLCTLDNLGPRAQCWLAEIIDDDYLIEKLEHAEDNVIQIVEEGMKPGTPVHEAKRNLVIAALDRFETWRPGKARPTSGQFPDFVALIYEAVSGRRDADLSRHIHSAFNDPRMKLFLRIPHERPKLS